MSAQQFFARCRLFHLVSLWQRHQWLLEGSKVTSPSLNPAGVHAGAMPGRIPALPTVRELGAAAPLPACSLPARKLLLMKFSPHFPSLSCILRNALPAPVSLALPPRARPACLYLRVVLNPSRQLQAHFQISLELLCRRLGFQALRCRGRQTRHLHPLDGNCPRCLLCPMPLRPRRLSSRLMQIDQILLSLIHQLKPWPCLLTALGWGRCR